MTQLIVYRRKVRSTVRRLKATQNELARLKGTSNCQTLKEKLVQLEKELAALNKKLGNCRRRFKHDDVASWWLVPRKDDSGRKRDAVHNDYLKTLMPEIQLAPNQEDAIQEAFLAVSTNYNGQVPKSSQRLEGTARRIRAVLQFHARTGRLPPFLQKVLEDSQRQLVAIVAGSDSGRYGVQVSRIDGRQLVAIVASSDSRRGRDKAIAAQKLSKSLLVSPRITIATVVTLRALHDEVLLLSDWIRETSIRSFIRTSTKNKETDDHRRGKPRRQLGDAINNTNDPGSVRSATNISRNWFEGYVAQQIRQIKEGNLDALHQLHVRDELESRKPLSRAVISLELLRLSEQASRIVRQVWLTDPTRDLEQLYLEETDDIFRFVFRAKQLPDTLPDRTVASFLNYSEATVATRKCTFCNDVQFALRQAQALYQQWRDIPRSFARLALKVLRTLPFEEKQRLAATLSFGSFARLERRILDDPPFILGLLSGTWEREHPILWRLLRRCLRSIVALHRSEEEHELAHSQSLVLSILFLNLLLLDDRTAEVARQLWLGDASYDLEQLGSPTDDRASVFLLRPAYLPYPPNAAQQAVADDLYARLLKAIRDARKECRKQTLSRYFVGKLKSALQALDHADQQLLAVVLGFPDFRDLAIVIPASPVHVQDLLLGQWEQEHPLIAPIVRRVIQTVFEP